MILSKIQNKPGKFHLKIWFPNFTYGLQLGTYIHEVNKLEINMGGSKGNEN